MAKGERGDGGGSGAGETFLTLRPEGEDVRAFYRRVAAALVAAGAPVVLERCHAAPGALREVEAARRAAYGAAGIEAAGALALVGQRSCSGHEVAGVQLWLAPAGAEVAPLGCDGEVVGRACARGDARVVWLPEVGPRDPGLTRQEQARSMLHEAGRLLGAVGSSWRRVLRTWIYLPELLAWYPAFNAVRREAFREAGLLAPADGGGLPASTGIEGTLGASVGASVGGDLGGSARGRAACSLSVLALADDGLPLASARAVRSPVQCEALAYGAAFARAVELGGAGASLLFVSGTASIGPGGESLHPGDLGAQARHTLAAVAELLAAAGHAPGDAVHAVAYLKDGADAPAFRALAGRAGFDPSVLVETEADVCRAELLIELEVTSVRRATSAP
ncbi:MAG: hypothetical protein IT373_05010 [Polyangiaceae bacterium]|nr:hypothetical protein [Polyangiaceae bacterium]